MHNLDRVRLELPFQGESFETPALAAEQFEFEEEGPYQHGQLWGETENMELASEMLEVSNETEMENFIFDLVGKAVQPLGLNLSDEKKRALAGVLKGAAKQILPGFGGMLGGQAGADAAARAGQIFGLELEGLSAEDREFEVARRFVDFAGQAAGNMARLDSESEQGMSISNAIAKVSSAALSKAFAAANAAAALHAPGLPRIVPAAGQPGQSGRWERQGNRIVLHGV